MPNSVNAYTVATGTSSLSPVLELSSAPTATTINGPSGRLKIGQRAIVKSTNTEYVLTSFTAGSPPQANWQIQQTVSSSGATGTVLTGVTGSNPVFSATPTVTSITLGSGNALSTYTEATSFTPAIAFNGASVGVTYNARFGIYYKIGKIVFFSTALTLSSKGSSTGTATITGLPFTSAATSPIYYYTPSYGVVTLTAGALPLIILAPSSSSLLLYQTDPAGTQSQLSDTAFANSSSISVTGFYFSAT